MTMKVGRCGTDVTLGDPSEWNANGDSVTITGYLSAATQADVNVLREQLLGYADNPDEEIIPVTWTVDSRVDGFYRVLDVQVAEDPNNRVALTLPYRLELERVPGFAAPAFESVFVGTLRTNAHAITTGVPHVALPEGTNAYYDGNNYTAVSRTTSDGAIQFLYTAATGTAQELVGRYLMPVSATYVGAAKIEVGATLRTMVGHQISASPTAWRLSNGLVRVSPNVATPGQLDVSHFDGTQWETAKVYKFGNDFGVGDVDCSAFYAVTVLRNSPASCSIRLSCDIAAGDPATSRYFLDLTLRRGSRYIECFMSSDEDGRSYIRRATVEAATAITGGIRATSDDASGNRYVLLTPDGKTDDLVNGGMTESSSLDNSFSFAIGSEIGGSAAVVPERATDLRDHYFFVESDQELVVGR